ncbi:MAG TPA: DoxX family protein [Acidimicrobiales bacterium]|nr:DoxX family protein [Acidimicrobiales bacterium]
MTIPTAKEQTSRGALGLLLASHPPPAVSDGALVVARVALAWIFTYYGAGKLFGAFHGPGLHRSALFFSQTAHLRPGGLFAVVGGVIEFGGALGMAFGLASRLAALALLGDQVVAIITVTGRHGINSLSATPGYEFNLTLCALAIVVIAFGAGRLSIDAVFARRLRT